MLKTRIRKAKRPAHFNENNTLAFVSTASGETIMLDWEDYDRLMVLGISPNWSLIDDQRGNKYVAVWYPKMRNMLPIARLVMSAGRGEVVRYRTPDRCDLRKKNLFTEGGPAKRDQHIPTFDPFQFG